MPALILSNTYYKNAFTRYAKLHTIPVICLALYFFLRKREVFIEHNQIHSAITHYIHYCLCLHLIVYTTVPGMLFVRLKAEGTLRYLITGILDFQKEGLRWGMD